MDENKSILDKPDTLSPDEIRKWLSRAKTAQKYFLRRLMPKYNCAKRRYNSEIGYSVKSKTSINKMMAKHTDINLLYKDIKDFTSSVFFRNPQVDLTSRNQDDENAVRNIENLEQKVNDDIKDDISLKRLIRSTLTDENLASLGAVYIDYSYRDRDLTDESGSLVMIEGTENAKRDVIENRVMPCKILPENLIVPPWIRQYNYKTGPYLGYADIVTLEGLKSDSSLNQGEVKNLKGATYKELADRELENKKEEENSEDGDDDIRHVKCFYLFIRGVDDGVMKRLVLADEGEGVLLAYDDWDKGHVAYPIHVLMLNDADSDSFLPPSEAWILETILQVIDYVYEKMNKHLRKSGTRTYVKEGQGGLKKAHIDKIVRNINQEIIGISDLPPGTDIRSLIMQVVDQGLSGDHETMFQIAKQMFDDLSRQPAFAKPTVVNKKKTATETQAIQGEDNSENGDYIDKFKDFLKDFFLDWCLLTQRNYQGSALISVEDKDTGDSEEREITPEEMQGDFNADINIESFMPPNKEVKRRIIKESLVDMLQFQPLLDQQGLELNGKKMVDELINNVEIRNSEDLVVPKEIRSIDQQVTDLVFKQVPMNPEQLGSDMAKAYERLAQLFADDQIMAVYEQLMPGIGQEGSPLIQMLQFLAQSQNGTAKKSPVSSAQTDVGLNASEMAGEQV